MGSEPAIRVENLAKCYRLTAGRPREAYSTLREALMGAFRRRSAAAEEEFWALNDVSFEVQPGEVVGIIGRNGAGKSTLLKILSRITKPTRGRVELNGRVGSLLEVGTGFHQELTGRENVFLNGSILGMSRREIARKFDEIVAFSEVEQFLDTPVKRYSSGMYVRLAFAVAAHLEPEILIVDEVLAVGDAGFQRKCLGKMGAVAKSGRTVLFVSHNMPAVQSLCTSGVLIASGNVAFTGPTDQAVARYVNLTPATSAGEVDLRQHAGRTTRQPMMSWVRLYDRAGETAAAIGVGEPLTLDVDIACPDAPVRPVLGVVVKDQYGTALFGNNNRVMPGFRFDQPMTEGTVRFHLQCVPLQPGRYSIDLHLGDEYADLDVVLDAIGFEVMPADWFGSGKLPPAAAGPFLVPAEWSITRSL